MTWEEGQITGRGSEGNFKIGGGVTRFGARFESHVSMMGYIPGNVRMCGRHQCDVTLSND